MASRPAFRHPQARPGIPRGHPRAPFWAIFGPPNPILGAKTPQKWNHSALPHQRKRNPTKKNMKNHKNVRRGTQTNQMPFPFLPFLLFVCSYFTLPARFSERKRYRNESRMPRQLKENATPKTKKEIHESLRTKTPNKPDAVIFPFLFLFVPCVPELRV